MTGFDIDQVFAAQRRIASYVAETPVVAMMPTGIGLKAESLHPTGAFKLRGAFNALLLLGEAERRVGVVAHSSGNHAQAVAYAAARLGIPALIVMPSDAPRSKLDATRRWATEVVLVGSASSERAQAAADLARERGLTPIEPYDAETIIAATGTIAVELVAQWPETDIILAPVSGGGLISGLAAAAKTLRPSIRVIGVEPEVAADAAASLTAGRLVSLPAEQMALTIADGLRVQQIGALNWPLIQAHVDDIVTVSEAEIKHAMARIASEARLVAEPSGAVAPAGALKLPASSGRTVAILSGGNVDLDAYRRYLGEQD